MFNLQIEQEINLVCDTTNIKSHFVTEWNTKYVPAILSYADKNTKKIFSNHLTKLNIAGQF